MRGWMRRWRRCTRPDKSSYGRPRIVHGLRAQGLKVGHGRVCRSLQRQALKVAYVRRKPLPGVILHSDRGSRYASAQHRLDIVDWSEGFYNHTAPAFVHRLSDPRAHRSGP